MTTEKFDQERDLAADLKLCEAATYGPWVVDVDGFGDFCVINEKELIASELNAPDAKLIAASRVGWPHAIQRAIAAETENTKLREALERMDDRKNAMLPRSVMARIAKETLDQLRKVKL